MKRNLDLFRQHFGSVAELEGAVNAPMKRETNRALCRTFAGRPSREWYGPGNTSSQDVERFMRDGYMAGAAIVDALYESVAATLPRALDHRRKRVRGDIGDELDIHAVNRGDAFRAWETTKRQIRYGSGLVRIVADVGGNAGMRASVLQWRGVAALALSRSLTRAGYSVEIIAADAGRGYSNGGGAARQLTSVTVKPRHSPVDTAMIAATICLPGFFRLPLFKAIVLAADLQGVDANSGLGQALDVDSVIETPEKVAQVVTPTSICDESSAREWLRRAHALLQHSTVSKG